MEINMSAACIVLYQAVTHLKSEILMSQGYLPSVWQQKHNDKDVLKSCYSKTCLNIHIFVKMFFEK